jgi:hypothetical protein
MGLAVTIRYTDLPLPIGWRRRCTIQEEKMITNELSTCKKCLDDFNTSELVWGDKGGMYWVCLPCYNKGEDDE